MRCIPLRLRSFYPYLRAVCFAHLNHFYFTTVMIFSNNYELSNKYVLPLFCWLLETIAVHNTIKKYFYQNLEKFFSCSCRLFVTTWIREVPVVYYRLGYYVDIHLEKLREITIYISWDILSVSGNRTG